MSNHLVDYQEYYRLSPEQSDVFSSPGGRTAALDFAEACRRREMDHLLLPQPGRMRGIPRA